MGFLTRRTLMTATLLAAMPAGKLCAAIPRHKGLDLSNSTDRHTAIVKMRGTFGTEMVMGYVAGRYYGYSEGRMTPLFGLLAGTFTQHRLLANGDVQGVTFELAYFTDWDTGELLERWKNPYTHRTVDVPRFRTEPGRFTISREGRIVTETVPAGGTHVDLFLEPVVVGNDVWITEANQTQVPTADPARPFFYNELVTMHALQSDLDNASLKSVPTAMNFQSEVSWRPWQQMGDTPGHLVGNAAGRKLTRIDDFPERYIPWSRKYHPDVFVDLPAFLNKGWS